MPYPRNTSISVSREAAGALRRLSYRLAAEVDTRVTLDRALAVACDLATAHLDEALAAIRAGEPEAEQ